MSGITPDGTPGLFYGHHAEPQSKNADLTGKYMVLSYLFPNTNAYKAYIRFTLIKFLDVIFNEQIKGFSALHDDVDALERFNELFVEETGLQIAKAYGNFMKSRPQELMKAFYENFPAYNAIGENPELLTNDMIAHLMRPYGMFDNIEEAERYISTNYDDTYKFKLVIAKVGNWIPIYENQENILALKAHGPEQQQVIDTIRKHHEEQQKVDEEFAARQQSSDKVAEEITRRIESAEGSKLKESIRKSTVASFKRDVLDEIAKTVDIDLRDQLIASITSITEDEVVAVREKQLSHHHYQDI